MKQEITGWQWHQLDHMQIMCTSLQTDNHASTSSLNFYRLKPLPDAQPTVSKYTQFWRQNCARRCSKNLSQQKSLSLSLSCFGYMWWKLGEEILSGNCHIVCVWCTKPVYVSALWLHLTLSCSSNNEKALRESIHPWSLEEVPNFRKKHYYLLIYFIRYTYAHP